MRPLPPLLPMLALATALVMGCRVPDPMARAQRMEDSGRLYAATLVLEQALKAPEVANPDGLQRRLLGLYERQGLFSEAIRHGEALRARGFAGPEDLEKLAQVYRADRQIEQAAQCYAALAAHPASAPAQRLEAAEALIGLGADGEAYAIIFGSDLQRDVSALALGVRWSTRRGAYGSAQDLLDAALAQHPAHQALLCAQGELRWAQGRLSEAEGAFLRALQADPEQPCALIGLGRLRLHQGNREEASQHLHRALARPDSWQAHLVLAELGEGQSLAPCQGARDLVGDHPLVLACESRVALEQDFQARAVNLARLGATLGPSYTPPWIALAQAQFALGEREEAIATLRAAREQRSGRYDLRLAEAALLRKKEEKSQAYAHYQFILQAHPEHAEALVGKGDLLLSWGRAVTAEALYKRALKADPANLEARYGLAEISLLLERGYSAAQQYEAIVARDPTQVKALLRLASIEVVEARPHRALAWLRRAAEQGASPQTVLDDPTLSTLSGREAFEELWARP